MSVKSYPERIGSLKATLTENVPHPDIIINLSWLLRLCREGILDLYNFLEPACHKEEAWKPSRRPISPVLLCHIVVGHVTIESLLFRSGSTSLLEPSNRQ